MTPSPSSTGRAAVDLDGLATACPCGVAADAGSTSGVAISDLEPRLEQHRLELTAHCVRMLGSASEAEDAVQETLVRAWRGFEGFEGRSSLRSWLYRIATNVCLDVLKRRQRLAVPTDFSPGSVAEVSMGTLPDRSGVAIAGGGARRRTTRPSWPSLGMRSGWPSSRRSGCCHPASGRC